MVKRQVRHVAASGITTVLVIAVVIFFIVLQFLALQRESRIAEELSNGLNDLQYLTTEFLVTSTPRALKQWRVRHERLGAFIAGVKVSDSNVRILLPELRTRHQSLGSVFERLTRIDSTIADPVRAEAGRRVAVARLLNQVLALSALRDRISGIYQEREASFLVWASAVLGGVLLVGVGVMVVLYIRVLQSIAANVELLAAAIVRLGEGDFTKAVPVVEEGDIGVVFAALEQARIRLADAIRQIELKRADLDHFVYVASHDFKAPLRGIDNLASWIEEDAGPVLNDAARGHLDMLRRRIRRLETLLEDLLGYSRAGRTEVASETVDVAQLLRGVVDDLHFPASVKVYIDDDMPVVYSPKAPLAHVFFNLIGNAVKHHDREEKRIEISGSLQDDGYAFTVCDDGPGIPGRFRERVFEVFQTLRPRDEVEGSGMGLSIAKRLVQSYNGLIEVIGDEGRGTCIRFTWHPKGEADVQSSGK